MKNIGRQKVTTKFITKEIDGSQTVSTGRTSLQTVYQKEDGTHHVNHMGGKMEVFLQDDGSFLKPWNVTSGISAMTGDDVLDMLKDHAAAERQAQIVPLFDGDVLPEAFSDPFSQRR